MATPLAPDVLAPLTESRAALLAFIRSKVSDPDAAEDILQESLLRALRAAPTLRNDDRLVSWFYQIVRNAIHDHYRRQGRAAQHLERYVREAETLAEPEDERRLCTCLDALIPTLKPEYAAALTEVDLNETASDVAAARLGITQDNLKVRRMRARNQLRTRLEETCRTCAAHGCLDCTCNT